MCVRQVLKALPWKKVKSQQKEKKTWKVLNMNPNEDEYQKKMLSVLLIQKKS